MNVYAGHTIPGMGMPHSLGGRTLADLAETAPTLLVPVGSTEQHGPHLPLDTDTRIATAVAASVAASLGTGAMVAPAIAYGSSGEHQQFAGTVSIGTTALTAVLTEYGRSALDWAQRVLFVNGHGGNLDALRLAVATLRREHRDVAWCNCTVTGADAHAGHTETSVMLHLSPLHVRNYDAVAGNTSPLSDLMPHLRTGGVAAVSDSGVLGDPSGASAEAGSKIFAEMVAECLRRVRNWKPGPAGLLT